MRSWLFIEFELGYEEIGVEGVEWMMAECLNG